MRASSLPTNRDSVSARIAGARDCGSSATLCPSSTYRAALRWHAGRDSAARSSWSRPAGPTSSLSPISIGSSAASASSSRYSSVSSRQAARSSRSTGKLTNGSASQRLSSTMLGAVAEYARGMTAERTQEAKERAVVRGVPPFPNVPPGYRRGEGRRLELDPGTASAVAEGFRLRAEGATIKKVREHLRSRRHRALVPRRPGPAFQPRLPRRAALRRDRQPGLALVRWSMARRGRPRSGEGTARAPSRSRSGCSRASASFAAAPAARAWSSGRRSRRGRRSRSIGALRSAIALGA